MAGGITVHDDAVGRSFHADSHSHPMPEATLALLRHTLACHDPKTIILERDDRLDAVNEIIGDIARIRACVLAARAEGSDAETVAGSAS